MYQVVFTMLSLVMSETCARLKSVIFKEQMIFQLNHTYLGTFS